MKRYRLRLYIAGNTLPAQCAVENIHRFGEKHLHGLYDLEVVDVLENPQLAEDGHILVTPTLVQLSPPTSRRVVGDLSDWETVSSQLDLAASDHPVLAPESSEIAPHVKRGVAVTDVNPRTNHLEALDWQVRKIIEAISDAVVVMDAEGHICFANPAAETLFGLPASKLLCLPFGFSVMTGRASTVDIPRADGVRVAEMHIVEVAWGNRPAWVASLRDITERQVLENNLKHSYERLETANNDLQRASEVKSRFLATMSHEIRTPISGVIGLTGLLLDTQLDPTQRDYAEDIRSSSEILLTLINDILDISKIEAEKMELESQPFELMMCVDEAIDLIRQKALEKGLKLCCEAKGELPCMFVGDVTRVRQILLNLLSNAIKFTKSGSVCVSVSGTQHADKQYELHFAVRDTGIGIPHDQQNRLFQSFSQVDQSTTRKFGGTGLGLAISKRLAELMGGTMWVKSTGVAGQGATFHVTIMVAEAAEQEMCDMRMEGLECLIDKNVLIVDEKPARGKVIAAQVAGWLMTAAATNSVTKATKLLTEENSFDVIIVDLPTLPMDRASLVGKMLGIATSQNIPVLTLTSRLEIGKNAAIAAQLVKPVSRQRLCNTLCTILGARMGRSTDKSAQRKAESFPNVEKHLHVLLAEDSPVNQKVTQMMLTKLGYRADLACNGQEAIQALLHVPYDVILMDCEMPEMNGYEATCHIRQMEKGENRNVYIIAMTAHAMEGDREKCIAAGMNDYLSKPVRLHELQQAIERCQDTDQLQDGRLQNLAATTP